MVRKIRLYFKKELKDDLISSLSSKQSHYIKNVMRVKQGDIISLFNSNDGEWDARIINHKRDSTEFKIEKISRSQEFENNLWLAFSPIKKIPLDMMIQKTTELGIQKFIPILCERSAVKDININRVKKIIVEASEQSNRLSIPEIKNMESIKDFLNHFPKNGSIIFCDINCREKNLKQTLSKKIEGPICILVGPEGDFSEMERQLIIDLDQSSSLSLASNILRAETAAIAAVTIVNFQLNSQ